MQGTVGYCVIYVCPTKAWRVMKYNKSVSSNEVVPYSKNRRPYHVVIAPSNLAAAVKGSCIGWSHRGRPQQRIPLQT